MLQRGSVKSLFLLRNHLLVLLSQQQSNDLNMAYFWLFYFVASVLTHELEAALLEAPYAKACGIKLYKAAKRKDLIRTFYVGQAIEGRDFLKDVDAAPSSFQAETNFPVGEDMCCYFYLAENFYCVALFPQINQLVHAYLIRQMWTFPRPRIRMDPVSHIKYFPPCDEGQILSLLCRLFYALRWCWCEVGGSSRWVQ